jgi:hypothetical protein
MVSVGYFLSCGEFGPRELVRHTGAGFDAVYVQQTGPDQETLFEAWATDVLPHLAKETP